MVFLNVYNSYLYGDCGVNYDISCDVYIDWVEIKLWNIYFLFVNFVSLYLYLFNDFYF